MTRERLKPERAAKRAKPASDGPVAKRKLEHQLGDGQPGMFAGIRALFVDGGGERAARIQIWKKRFESFGGLVCDLISLQDDVTHVLAANSQLLEGLEQLKAFHNLHFVAYSWLQVCLETGSLVPTVQHQLQDPWCAPAEVENGQEAASIARADELLATTDRAEALDVAKLQDEEGVGSSDDEIGSTDLKKQWKRKRNFYAKDDGPNQNKLLTTLLAEMWHIYEDVLDDTFKAISYRKVVNIIKGLPFELKNPEHIAHLPGIGKSMLHHIKEILGTGRYQKLEELKNNDEVVTVQKLASVWGIGAKQAREFFKKGYREVNELHKEPNLSAMVRVGLKYYDDMNKRIPREEVELAEKLVNEIVQKLAAGAWVNAAGSYRRGKPTCGDIDILISHPDGISHDGLLWKILMRLKNVGFIVDGTELRRDAGRGGSQPDTFMGICLPHKNGTFRRIDIKVYPKEVYVFALLAFTGNDVLNRKLRYLARRKRMKLSDQGLFLRDSSRKDARVSSECIPCETEKDVFDKLGVPYAEPQDRNW